jgi:hypothetical protein
MHNADAYKVGALWATSWGYDQTNVEHFEVVRETRGTVTVRRIASEYRDGRSYPVPGAYIVDTLLNMDHGGHDEELGYTEKLCRKPRPSKRTGETYDSLTIDDVRFAWPTTVDEGSYDTFAAGGAGH